MAEVTPGINYRGAGENTISRDNKGDSRHNLRWGDKERQRRPNTTYNGETRHADATQGTAMVYAAPKARVPHPATWLGRKDSSGTVLAIYSC